VASAFAALPAMKPSTFPTTTEEQKLGRVPQNAYGEGETRNDSGRSNKNLWLYALPNPYPEKPIRRIVCTPQQERAVIYGITTTNITEHPLRPGVRQKLRLTLPEGVQLNALGELEQV